MTPRTSSVPTLVAACCAALVAAACARAPSPDPEVPLARVDPIAEVRIEGNRRVETEAMMLELESGVGEFVSARNLAQEGSFALPMRHGRLEAVNLDAREAPAPAYVQANFAVRSLWAARRMGFHPRRYS